VFRFECLGGKQVVNIFENEFVSMGGVADGCSKCTELNGVEGGIIPVVYASTLLEESSS
jgi:hypothetical protein